MDSCLGAEHPHRTRQNYRLICPCGLVKFKRFAVNVWDVNPAGKSDAEVAAEGLERMEAWMKELGLIMDIQKLGVTEDMLEGIVEGTLIMEGGYKKLGHNEIMTVLKESFPKH